MRWLRRRRARVSAPVCDVVLAKPLERVWLTRPPEGFPAGTRIVVYLDKR